MLTVFRVLLLTVGTSATLVRAEGWALPIWAGNVAGVVTSDLLPGAPPIRWSVAVEPSSGTTQRLRLAADAEALSARVEVEVDPATRDGTWTLTGASIDLARWFPSLAGHFKASVSGLSIRGPIAVTGQGQLHHGVPVGTLAVTARDMRIADDAAGWALEGIDFDAEFAVDAETGAVCGTKPITLAMRTIITPRFGARNFSLTARLESRDSLALESARIEIAGGELSAAAAKVPLRPLAPSLEVTLTRIGLQDVAALVPGAVAEAHGRIDGRVILNWTDAQGFEVGNGTLIARPDEPAEVTLNPTPGLITSQIPKHVRPIILWFYPGLDKLELGQLPIRADLLEVTLTPQGDEQGRTAVVHLAGSPTDPKKRAPVDLVVNVHAPIKTLINLGTARGVHFGH